MCFLAYCEKTPNAMTLPAFMLGPLKTAHVVIVFLRDAL
jgi:hypothetical protein